MTKQTQLRLGWAAIGLAIAVAILGEAAFPHGLQWVIAGVLLWAGLTLVMRARGWRMQRRSKASAASRPRVTPLKPGESYQDAVKLALVPNVPLAEMWCQRLRENGIEAFYKGGSPYLAGVGATADLNPLLPAEIWVGEDDAGRARQLFPELRL